MSRVSRPKTMNLRGATLDEWFKKIRNLKNLPFEYDYPSKYTSIANELDTWVHPFVNSGAMINDRGYLTDHGPKHIKMLIKRASQFLNHNPNGGLSDTEILILLLAIHIHDVGNILGRNDHEVNAQVVIERLGAGVAGQDKIIWEYVYEIAKAHKGSVIQNLASEDWINENKVRPSLLAAIIKFTDELAEDSGRADRFNSIIGNVPPESELYHQYALSLDTLFPDIESRTIQMVFHLEEDTMRKKFLKKIINKNNDPEEIEIFLIDEIYLRVLKTHYERLYCMRFMRPIINFDSIRVNIKINMRDGTKINDSFDLIESGISDVHMDEVFKICPELKEKTGNCYFENLFEIVN